MSGRGSATSSSWWFDDPASGVSLPANWKGILHGTSARYGLTAEKHASVTDGLSNTLMIGEYHTKTQNRRRSFWAYTYTSYNQSSGVPQTRTLLPDYNQCVSIGGIGGSNPCKRGWGALHPNGLNFVMGDGSVRFLTTSIDMNTFMAMSTMAGGEVFNQP
jgi:prepilin-type processing-associated H-X9-DG protein